MCSSALTAHWIKFRSCRLYSIVTVSTWFQSERGHQMKRWSDLLLLASNLAFAAKTPAGMDEFSVPFPVGRM